MPRAASVRRPARTVGRLTPTWAARSRSGGRRAPGPSAPRSISRRTWATTCAALSEGCSRIMFIKWRDQYERSWRVAQLLSRRASNGRPRWLCQSQALRQNWIAQKSSAAVAPRLQFRREIGNVFGPRMQQARAFILATAVLITTMAQAGRPGGAAVSVTPDEAARRVDIAIGGAPFTSYIWPDGVKKPVLDPIRSATGTIVTRGWPLNPRPGERVDHPHHVGLWFNYESVNGVDFWNTSDALKPDELAKMGTIVHRRIVTATGGTTRGELVTESDWMLPGNKTLLHERTQFFFSGNGSARTIDRIATLTALDERVVFADAKDGMLGLRVARQLEQPSNEPLVFTDIAGRATTVPAMDNTGITGEYTSSEGKKGDAV